MSLQQTSSFWAGVLVVIGMLGACGRPESSGRDLPRASQEPVDDEGPAAEPSAPDPASNPTVPSRTTPRPGIAAIFANGCATESHVTPLLPSSLLFVLDRSASMACNPPPTTDSATCEAEPARADAMLPSKWEIARAALFAAVRSLPADTIVGLTYFSNDDGCGVHSRPSVPLAPMQRTHLSVINASLHAVQPDGATPLVGATILAYRHLHDAALAGQLRGNKFVVLITDGSQSEPCSDERRCAGAEDCTELLIADEVPRASGPGVGIKTFVVGVPGSEHARGMLSRLAREGGTAEPGCDLERGDCHFDMSRSEDLTDDLTRALTEVATRALTCDFALPTNDDGEVDLERVNVIYSGSERDRPELLAHEPDRPCEDADGWQYTDTDGQTRVRLCGSACEQVRSDPNARVDIVLGCPSHRPL